MVAIIALGGFTMLDCGKYSGTPPFQDRKEETTKPCQEEGDETSPNLEPVGNHSKFLRGWRDPWRLKAKYEKAPTGKAQGQATSVGPVGKNCSKHKGGWRWFWPFKETKPPRVALNALRPVGTQSSNREAQGPETEHQPTNTHLVIGPQAASAKQGSAYWFQQWFHHPHELVVGMTTGGGSEEDAPPLPPEEPTAQDETTSPPEVAEEPPENARENGSDSEDEVSLEQMRCFARSFSESFTTGDEHLESDIDRTIANMPDQAGGDMGDLVTI